MNGLIAKAITLDNRDELLCPECKSRNLHHTTVDVLNRISEDKEGIRVFVDKQQVTSEAAFNAMFTGRRNEIRIGFWCEECEYTPTLLIQQHKGTTYIGWWDGKIPKPLP